MRKLLPLKGTQAMHALNAYSCLLLGLWMLPSNIARKTRIEFLGEMKALPPDEQETWLREALSFVRLSAEEIGALVSFATDPNGIAFQPANIGTLDLAEIYDICVLVCIEISKIKVSLVSEAEQKKNTRRCDRPETNVPEVP